MNCLYQLKRAVCNTVGHDWQQTGQIYHGSEVVFLSANPCTAHIFHCRQCGAERRELTDAGKQQLSWGDDLGKLMGHNS